MFLLRAEVSLIRLYLLKYNAFTTTEYERCWARLVNKKFLSMNEHIPCSYFQLTLKSLTVNMTGSEQIVMSVRKASVKNIKLFASPPEEEEMEFHDPINRSTRSLDIRGVAADNHKDNKIQR